MTFVFVLAILMIVFVLGPIARSYAARLERGGGTALPGNAHEVARLREEVDRLGTEVARLSEEQAFTLKLLSSGERPQTPGSASQAG